MFLSHITNIKYFLMLYGVELILK